MNVFRIHQKLGRIIKTCRLVYFSCFAWFRLNRSRNVRRQIPKCSRKYTSYGATRTVSSPIFRPRTRFIFFSNFFSKVFPGFRTGRDFGLFLANRFLTVYFGKRESLTVTLTDFQPRLLIFYCVLLGIYITPLEGSSSSDYLTNDQEEGSSSESYFAVVYYNTSQLKSNKYLK